MTSAFLQSSLWLCVEWSRDDKFAELWFWKLHCHVSHQIHLFCLPSSPCVGSSLSGTCGCPSLWCWHSLAVGGSRRQSMFLGQITVFLQHILSAPVLFTQCKAVSLFSDAPLTKAHMQSDWHQIWFCYQQQNRALSWTACGAESAVFRL